MKKILALLLAASMVMTLASCAQKTEGPAGAGSSEENSSGEVAKTDFPKTAIVMQASSAGSTLDAVARVYAQYLGKYLGVNVIVTNTAGQTEAARALLSAEPDGYTIAGLCDTVVIRDVQGSTDFNSIEDLTILSMASYLESNWIAISTATAEKYGIQTLDDLKAATQANPGELTMTDSQGSNTNINVRQLIALGFEATAVDAGTGTDRLTTFITGSADIYIGQYSYIDQYIQQGDVMCLASISEERNSFTPDVPCTYELGYEISCPVYYYLYGPAGIPDEIVEIYEEATQKMCEDPEYIAAMEQLVLEPYYRNSEEATRILSDYKAQMIELGMGEGYQG